MDELIISPSTSSQEKCVELLNILSLEECLKSSDLVKKLKDEAFVKAEESDFCRLVLDETKKKLRSEMIEIGPALKQLDTLEAELVLLSQRIDLEGQAKLIRSMLQKRVTSIGRLKLFRDLLGDLIQIITLVDEIKSESIIAPRNALDLYRKLRNLSLDEGKNKQARPTTAYEFLHRYLEKCKAEAISVMREKFTSELFKSLSKIGWPKSMYAKGFEKGLKGSDLELWVSMLLKLEKLEGEKKKLRFYKDMLQEVTDEFKYHFCGPRQTSRLDRPEWAFEWVLKFVQTQLPFFQDFLQYVHDKNSYRNIDSVNQMVSVFLEVLESKIAADKAALLESPENIIRYVKETANFEDSLIRYNIIPDIVSEADEFQKYRLVDALVCDDQIFTALINYMKSSSIETLKRMFTSNIALALVYDAVIELDSTKITQSADMLISILEYVKNFHKSLPNIDHRLVFVKDIELMILKKYITYVLDAFRKIYDSHPLRPDLMCRCATSIYTAGLIIKEISNSENILDITSEVERCPQNQSLKLKKDKVLEEIDEVKSRYSETLNILINTISGSIAQLFVEACSSYIQRYNLTEYLLRRRIFMETNDKYRSWLMSKDSRTVRKVDGVSPSLIGALKTAEVSIETCRNNLPYALFRKQIAGIFKEIDNQLLHNLVNKWEVQFDDSGAAQFKVDVEKGIESLCCGDQKLKVAKKLRDACILLNLRNTLNAQSDTSLERNLGMNLKINMKKRGVIDDIHMILYRFIEDTSHNYASVLESINVFNLSKQDALDILDSIAN